MLLLGFGIVVLDAAALVNSVVDNHSLCFIGVCISSWLCSSVLVVGLLLLL